MKWYKLNHERMVELNLCATMSADRLIEESFGEFMILCKCH